MRNELIGYLSIPVIVAGGMSVWKGINPDSGFLPDLPSLKWNKDEDRLKHTKDEFAALNPEEAEESDDDGDASFADQGGDDDR